MEMANLHKASIETTSKIDKLIESYKNGSYVIFIGLIIKLGI